MRCGPGKLGLPMALRVSPPVPSSATHAGNVDARSRCLAPVMLDRMTIDSLSANDAPTLAAAVADAVARYEATGDAGTLVERLVSLAREADADALVAAAEPFRQQPEVAGILYERVVALRPNDARALVVLANSYWLTGRGPDVVGELATRAIAADATNRGAWHLWALTEANPRQRTQRWQQVTKRFPDDQLAKALLADNAASLAGAEHDDEALVLAIATYEELLATAEQPQQRAALERALTTLRGWKL